MRNMTIREATSEWISKFNAYPHSMIYTLMKAKLDDWYEVTFPDYGDRVYIWDGEYTGEYGTIEECCYNDVDDLYYINFDDKNLDGAAILRDQFDVIYDDYLPIWETLWSFDNSADNYWLEELDGIRKMSQCGFRIYENEEWGYFFGIDGAGYSFMDAHWIPLYKARGLKWHNEDEI